MPYRTGVPHFGPNGTPEKLNESVLPNLRQTLGTVWERGSKRWQIVKIVDAANVAIGDVVYWKNQETYTVTPTIANGSQSEVAGVMEVIAGAANNIVAVRQGGLMSVKSADATLNARGFGITSDVASNQAIKLAGVVASIGVTRAAQAAGFVSAFLNIQPV